MTAPRNERGIALVIVLWVGLLVVAIAGAFIVDTRNSTRLTRNFLDNAEARALADGGIHLAVFELLRTDIEDEMRWRRDGRLYNRVVHGGTLEIAVEDEAGKIDLNISSIEILEGLFQSVGVGGNLASAFVEAIEKIRSGDELSGQPFRSPGTSTGPSEGTPDQVFFSVDSLGQIPGMTAELHARLLPAITVFGDQRLHYLSSPREVLLAIPDITVEAVDAFLEGRMADEADEPLDEFLLAGRARAYWRKNESKVVTVKVLARAGNGAKFARVAVVELANKVDQPFIVKEWREGDAQSLWRPSPAPVEAGELSGGAT